MGGTAEQNAAILSGVLGGETGPAMNVVVMNAAAAIVAGGLAGDLPEGAARADEAVASGRAQGALDRLIQVSNS